MATDPWVLGVWEWLWGEAMGESQDDRGIACFENRGPSQGPRGVRAKGQQRIKIIGGRCGTRVCCGCGGGASV